MSRRAVAAVGAIFALAALTAPAATAQEGDVGPDRETPPAAPTGDIVRVPGDRPTIQDAVDHAVPGDLILIDPGVYLESVTVTVPFLTIRGVDRVRTIVDGGFERANGIQVIEADGVAIENLTSRNHLVNGVLWTDVFGYRGSYLTASNNGEHGISAYASRYGQLDHSYASGSSDAGFSIEACDPCDAVITEVEAAHNQLGYSGTNAGGDLQVVNSEFHDNAAGIVASTLDAEPAAPQRDTLIAGNHVHDNAEDASIRSTEWTLALGNGVVVAGGVGNRIVGNLVEDQPAYGIVLLPISDERFWPTSDTIVRGNVVRRSGVADLAITGPTAGGDCFEDNVHGSSTPGGVEALFPCSGFRPNPAGGGAFAPWTVLGPRLLADPRLSDQRDRPEPPPQTQMPGDPALAPPAPAIPEETVPALVTIRAVGDVPVVPGPEQTKEPTVLGLPIATSWGTLLLGLYGYLLPFVLYAAWVAVAMWDLIRQESEALAHRSRWMLVVLVVPFAGPLLYFAFGRSPIPPRLRLTLTVGGVAVYLAFVLVGAVLAR